MVLESRIPRMEKPLASDQTLIMIYRGAPEGQWPSVVHNDRASLAVFSEGLSSALGAHHSLCSTTRSLRSGALVSFVAAVTCYIYE